MGKLIVEVSLRNSVVMLMSDLIQLNRWVFLIAVSAIIKLAHFVSLEGRNLILFPFLLLHFLGNN
jgi:hypothetical protein